MHRVDDGLDLHGGSASAPAVATVGTGLGKTVLVPTRAAGASQAAYSVVVGGGNEQWVAEEV